jgi:hypothetical protein
MKKLIRFLILILPFCLIFSYHPVISFGSSELMNLEISIPIIWLIIFDVVGFVALIKEKKFFTIYKKWMFLLFPTFLTASILWSINMTRGFLVMGVFWLILIAVYIMYELRSWFNETSFKKKFLKCFFGAGLLVVGWCLLQCILDLVGVSRDVSLICAGCISKTFGFPHPNGFAIEPQFMGNLLLAPIFVSLYLLVNEEKFKWKYAVLAFIFVAALFLVFSRGAIYAFIVGAIFMTVLLVVKAKEKGFILKRIGVGLLISILAFLFTLNMQGVMAALGPTNDNYVSGVTKVVNQLSLGVIDFRVKNESSSCQMAPEESTDGKKEEQTAVIDKIDSDDKEKTSTFDGYVEESTEVRLWLNEKAIEIWKSDTKNLLVGVGIGGAGEALYEAGFTDSPKEIIQNQYISLLLETGIVGVLLLVLMIVLVVIYTIRNGAFAAPLVLTLFVVFGVSLCFFAGLPNVIHIYLLPMVLYIVFKNKKCIVD